MEFPYRSIGQIDTTEKKFDPHAYLGHKSDALLVESTSITIRLLLIKDKTEIATHFGDLLRYITDKSLAIASRNYNIFFNNRWQKISERGVTYFFEELAKNILDNSTKNNLCVRFESDKYAKDEFGEKITKCLENLNDVLNIYNITAACKELKNGDYEFIFFIDPIHVINAEFNES